MAIAANPQGDAAPEPVSAHPPLLLELELDAVPELLPELLLDPLPELLLDPLPELPLDAPLLELELLLDPPPLELPPAPASDAMKLQYGALHTAPCALHLQSVSTVHHPLTLALAGTHAIGVWVQSQTWVPHPLPGQSISLVQAAACAEAVHSDEAVRAAAKANTNARISMANLLSPLTARTLHRSRVAAPVAAGRTTGCNPSTAAVNVHPKRTGLLYPPASVRARSLLRPPPGELPAGGRFLFLQARSRPAGSSSRCPPIGTCKPALWCRTPAAAR